MQHEIAHAEVAMHDGGLVARRQMRRQPGDQALGFGGELFGYCGDLCFVRRTTSG
jgi:hypothetical protein